MENKSLPENMLTVYGTDWCGDCKRAKKFLGEQRVQYNWVNVEHDPEGLAFLERAQRGGHSVPLLLFADGSTLVEPSNAQLAEKLGISTRARQQYYDVIVVGGGPAGLTAALYTAREGLTTLVIDGAGLGGQAGITERLDNFPGFPEGVSGAEFADRLAQQARRFDVETVSAQKVTGLRADGEYRLVTTEDGTEYAGKAVLIATGSEYRRLSVPGEDDLIGAGVHYCATCDGPFYKGKRVAVLGGGNSAVEEGIFLTRFADHVTLVVRGDELKASQVAMDKYSEEEARGKIDTLYSTEIVDVRGDHRLEEVRVKDLQSGETRRLEPRPDGLFVFIGLRPNSAWLPTEIKRDDKGFVLTSPTLETTMPGVFAAGDVRADSTKQAASAAGEGATAALAVRDLLRKLG